MTEETKKSARSSLLCVRRVLRLGTLILWCSSAGAQTTPSNPGGFLNTDPRSPAYNSGLSVPPKPAQPARVDSWGAIALDNNGHAGIVTSKSNKRLAQKDALIECGARGGVNCEIVRTFSNQCAAVVTGQVGTFTAQAPYEDQAIDLGQLSCTEAGGGCRVYYSGCSLSPGVQ